MTNELLPCPFCGSEPELFCDGEHWQLKAADIVCKNKDCRGKLTELTENESSEVTRQKIITKWNTRTAANLLTVEGVMETIKEVEKMNEVDTHFHSPFHEQLRLHLERLFKFSTKQVNNNLTVESVVEAFKKEMNDYYKMEVNNEVVIGILRTALNKLFNK